MPERTAETILLHSEAAKWLANQTPSGNTAMETVRDQRSHRPRTIGNANSGVYKSQRHSESLMPRSPVGAFNQEPAHGAVFRDPYRSVGCSGDKSPNPIFRHRKSVRSRACRALADHNETFQNRARASAVQSSFHLCFTPVNELVNEIIVKQFS